MMRKPLFLLLVFSGISCLPVFIMAERNAAAPPAQDNINVKQHNRITVRVANDSDPTVDLSDGVALPVTYTGSSAVQQLFNQGAVRPCALGSGDFDEDGVPDLIAAYKH